MERKGIGRGCTRKARIAVCGNPFPARPRPRHSSGAQATAFAYDRDTWKSGEPVRIELWLINDHWTAVPGLAVTWRLEDGAGRAVVSGASPGRLDLLPDCSVKLMDVGLIAGPPCKDVLRATAVEKEGKAISENNYEFKVKEQ